ncbi:MAG TPA: sigma-70 family RNA polymerase sigma factor [Sedimentisphaerales bacterium]|nr:sigma-70 family RNA polymerase sigma factor [Sedimentisphaerales bacterium]
MDRSVEQLVDEILVMDCQSGSVKALEILVSRWQKRLWRYAYNLTGDTEAAWDITQDSWLGIIKGLRKLHDPANFKAWAYRITTNKSIDWIRKSKAVKQISIEEIEEQQTSQKKDTGVKELLEKLDIRKQVIISLYYFEQLSVPEISAALKIPKGTVKSRLYKARKELKELYQKHIE